MATRFLDGASAAAEGGGGGPAAHALAGTVAADAALCRLRPDGNTLVALDARFPAAAGGEGSSSSSSSSSATTSSGSSPGSSAAGPGESQRSRLNLSRVAVLSGGGAGHEPAHAGLVGDALLAGAVSGLVFASPAVQAILAAIAAAGVPTTQGGRGVLLVVKCYQGDLLNFGLAAERARAELGIDVRVVRVGDDVALRGKKEGITPRGLAGTLLVHKIAGFCAARGDSLDDVATAAAAAAAECVTLGVSLSTCGVPGSAKPAPFADGEHELGLGIHGEAGAERRSTTPPVRELVREMLGMLSKHLPADCDAEKEEVAVVVNNLGATSALEMGVITRDVLAELGGRARILLGPAPLMTSLDMYGFSLTLLPLRNAAERKAGSDATPAAFDTLARVQALVAPVGPRAWTPVSLLNPSDAGTDESRTLSVAAATGGLIPDAAEAAEAVPASSRDAAIDARLDSVCTELQGDALVAELNDLDAISGDGDTGHTFAVLGAEVAKDLAAGTIATADPAAALAAVSRACGRTGGSSGVILAIGLAAAAAHMREGATDTAGALGAFVDAVQQHGGAQEGDCTLLDALVPALAAARAGEDVAAAAAKGAEATAAMAAARAGRAANVTSKSLEGHADPGAVAVARIIALWLK